MIWLVVGVLGLSSCTTSIKGDYCLTDETLTFDEMDTDRTKLDILEHNAIYESICE